LVGSEAAVKGCRLYVGGGIRELRERHRGDKWRWGSWRNLAMLNMDIFGIDPAEIAAAKGGDRGVLTGGWCMAGDLGWLSNRGQGRIPRVRFIPVPVARMK